MQNLVEQVLAQAKDAGFSQKDLAQKIGITAEALTRGKKRGSISLATLQHAANIAGLDFRVVPKPSAIHLAPASVMWSNRAARNDPSKLPARLANASFADLIELCRLHGIERVEKTLEAIQSELKPGQYRLERAMLNNVIKAFSLVKRNA